MFHYPPKDNPARTTSSVFKSIPWVETQSHVVLPISLRFFLLQCLGDKTSNLKFASILSAAYPIHMHHLQEPRAKMPLCSVTAQPGAVRRSNNVNKRADEEQKNKQTCYCACKNCCYQEIKKLHVAYAAWLHSALLFNSEITATRYKENQDLQKKKNWFTKPGEVTKMSFSSLHFRDCIFIFMAQNTTLRTHYISFLKDGIDLNFKKFCWSFTTLRGLQAPQCVILKDKEITNWLGVCLSAFKCQ